MDTKCRLHLGCPKRIKNSFLAFSLWLRESSCLCCVSHSSCFPAEEPQTAATTNTNQNTPRKLRFVQLYTSKSFENRRGELVNPEDDGGIDDEPVAPVMNGLTKSTKKKHKLSPVLVDAISKTMQVVWTTSGKQEGLAGTSGIPLHTAVGMPVAMDNNGNMCCVVMFSPNSIASTDDAMEYLQNISQCATSASIPCLLPVVANSNGRSLGVMQQSSMNGGSMSTSICKETQQQHITAFNASWGGGVAVQFASLDKRQGLHDMKEAPKDTFGIPMLPDFTEGEVFDEASYGVWTTIMEQALTDEDVLQVEATAPRSMEPIRISEDCKTRLEEFLFAFLGLSSFDLADVWIYSPDCDALQQFTSVTETGSLSEFQSESTSAQIQTWEGAIGRAFASGDPVWTSDPNEFQDSHRATVFASSGIRTVLAVPVFSTQRSHPACVVACYALVPSRSVAFVLRFVQQALRLLWSGLDAVEPHGAVGKTLWQDVTPVCLGEMAADVEMQHHFMSKKRPLSLMTGDERQQEEQPVPGDDSEPSESSNTLPTYQEVQNHLFDAVKSVSEAVPVADQSPLQDHIHRAKRPHISEGSPLLMPQPLPISVIHAPLPPSTQSQPNPVHVHSVPFVNAPTIHYPVSTQYCENAGATVLAPAPGAVLEVNQPQDVSTTLAAQIAAAQMQSPVNVDPIAFLSIIQNERQNQNTNPVPDNVASYLNVNDLVPNSVPGATYCAPIGAPPVEPLSFSDTTAVRNCKIQGCGQLAIQRRPYCTKHSGNRLCEKPGCQKCAQGSTRFCIAHGGGRRCTFPGCDKGARDKFFCAAHGGGKRCQQEGCSKSAVGGSNRCTAHGGGRRCSVAGCSKSAQSSTNFCVKHGGGKKCSQRGCLKVARGRTQFCASHGGGVRCRLEGCNRVAIGKQQLCRTHGGFSSRANGGGDI